MECNFRNEIKELDIVFCTLKSNHTAPLTCDEENCILIKILRLNKEGSTKLKQNISGFTS